jgi:hypothetical protein
MTPNMGTTDRIVRFVVGIALLSLLFVLEGNARWWGLLGVPLIGTALLRFCPPYKWLGINTLGRREGGTPQ